MGCIKAANRSFDPHAIQVICKVNEQKILPKQQTFWTLHIL